MAIPKEEIIQSTLKLVHQHGWDKVSVRMISKEIGYSTIKIYSDFGSKEQLLFEIQKKGFAKLRQEYQAAIAQSDSPELKLERLALVHVRFALNEPTYYELMFSWKFINCKSEAAHVKQKTGMVIFDVVKELGVAEPRIAFMQFFSMLYGYVELSKELLDQKGPSVESTIEKFVHNFIHGIQ